MTLPSRRRDGAIALALAALTIAVFWPVGTFDFISLDDPLFITENSHIAHGLTWEGIKWAFRADLTEQSTNADYWQPVVFLSRMLDIQLFGLNPGGHHAMNLLFHTLNVILLFALFRRATGASWPSAFVAAVFAVHPLQVEPVAWVTARKDVLSVCFGLLALHAWVGYARRPSAVRYLAVAALFALALMSKPMMVTLPFVMLLLDYWPLGRELRARLVIEKLSLLAMAAGASAITLMAGQATAFHNAPSGSLAGYVVVSYGWYLAKIVGPAGLALHAPAADMKPQLWPLVGSAVLLAAMSILVVRRRRRQPYLVVGWLWLLGTLVPVVGLLARMERLAYLPIVGALVMAGWAAVEWRRGAAGIATAAVVAACAIQTSFHLPNWKDSIALSRHTLEIEPDNWMAHHILGEALLTEGKRLDEAEAHFAESLHLQPNNPKARASLGVALGRRGKFEQAILHLQEALQTGPDNAVARYNLGFALQSSGRLDEAIAEYEHALRLKPDDALTHSKLGLALANRGRLEAARVHFAAAARLQPGDPDAHGRLAQALAETGRIGEAMGRYREALRLKPDHAATLNNLAWLLATHPDPEFRDGPEAVRLAERACAAGKDAVLLDTLAAAYAEAGRFDDAVRTAQEALDLAGPEVPGIRERLSLYRRGKPYRETTGHR